MAKKKKASPKFVARPVQTTAVAKQVVMKPREEIQEGKEAIGEAQINILENNIGPTEHTSLQLLVYQQQAKTKKEGLRDIKGSNTRIDQNGGACFQSNSRVRGQSPSPTWGASRTGVLGNQNRGTLKGNPRRTQPLSGLESSITRNTRLAFVTEGVALRILETDGRGGSAFDEITLCSFKHIIIDEVHERSIGSDFLLIALKDMMKCRPDLKYDRADVGYNRYRKGHKKHCHFKSRAVEWSEEVDLPDDDDDVISAPVKVGEMYSPSTITTISNLNERRIPYDLILRLLEEIFLEELKYSKYSAAILVFLPSFNKIRYVLSIHPCLPRAKLLRLTPQRRLLYFDQSPDSQSKRLYASETEPANDLALILVVIANSNISLRLRSGKHDTSHKDKLWLKFALELFVNSSEQMTQASTER
ncbi:hypothetical protein B0J17DRAFT_710885 [Rhizoctonia solani]|nr:hypothetical protein B0J17DRAFT_710885 [Rhizoctonia solani]